MKRIGLVIPPSPFLLDERVFLHLGILKVAAVLEGKGIVVDVLDLSGVRNYLDVVEDYSSLHKDVSMVGITATTPQIPFAANIGRLLRDLKVKTVLGGPHGTLMNTASKREKARGLRGRAVVGVDQLKSIFDVIVCGDGELAIFEAMEVERGIVDADDRKSYLFLSDNDTEELPFPARHLVNLDSYKYYIEGERATSLISQLGCPFKCAFCSGRNSPFLRNIRTRSIDSVVAELEHMYLKYGYKGFMFYDDELNVNPQVVALMQAVTKLQRKYRERFMLRGFVKAELFNKDQAESMYEAGFRWLLTGFESGDPKILKVIEKGATLEDNTACVDTARKSGLKVKALMSIGHAGENDDSLVNTKNWLLSVKPDDFDCTVITTYPGAPYFDDAVLNGDCYTYTDKKTGARLHQKDLNYLVDQDYYKGDPVSGYVSYVWTDHLSASQLVMGRDQIEREVRGALGIPFNTARPGVVYERSMGMGNIPDAMLRSSGRIQWEKIGRALRETQVPRSTI